MRDDQKTLWMPWPAAVSESDREWLTELAALLDRAPAGLQIAVSPSGQTPVQRDGGSIAFINSPVLTLDDEDEDSDSPW